MYEKEELLKITDDYKRAYTLVSILFKDITDKEGAPYLNHLIRVSDKLENKNTKVAGLLHDTVEDIPNMSFEKLKELGFNDDIIELVKIVTHEPSSCILSKEENKKKYHNEITKILNSNNIEAVKLKYADMSDNFNKERLSLLDEETRKKLIEKYKDEIIRLESYLKERERKI